MPVHNFSKYQSIRTTNLVPSTALPAAGAYLVSGWFDIGLGAEWISLWVSYTKGAGANGSFKLVVEWEWIDDPTVVGQQPIVDDISITVTAPFGAVPSYTMEIDGPVTTTNGVWPYTLVVPPGTKRMRVQIGEKNTPATPGTVVVRAAVRATA